jgi:hypothetical protein
MKWIIRQLVNFYITKWYRLIIYWSWGSSYPISSVGAHIHSYTREKKEHFFLLGNTCLGSSWLYSFWACTRLSIQMVHWLFESHICPETSVTWRLHASLPAPVQSWQCRMGLKISFEWQNLNRVSKQSDIFNAEMIIPYNFADCEIIFLSFCYWAVIILLWFEFFVGKEDGRTK